MSNFPDRIPYDNWINSQLSIARHYGGCRFYGVYYECDYDNCKTIIGDDGETKYFPDLVKVNAKNENDKHRSGGDAMRDFSNNISDGLHLDKSD